MKSKICSMFAAALVFMLESTIRAETSAGNHQYVVAIAEGLSKAKGDEILRASLDLLLKTAEPGDRVQIFNAPHAVRLADLTVPSGTARDRANSREFSGKLVAVKKLLSEPLPNDARLAGQLRFAQLLDSLCRGRRADEPLTVIVVGSPVFVTASPAEVAFNFDGGLVPADGMVLASSSQSLFGTDDRKQQARGITVHWITPDDRWGVSEMHRQALLRFWSFFCQQQSANLASFSSDAATVFARAVQAESRPLLNVSAEPNDRSLIMRPPPAFHRETVSGSAPPTVEIPAASPSAPIAVPRPPTETNTTRSTQPAIPASVAGEIPQAAHGHIGIAAIWLLENSSPDTDVDLWVSSDAGRVPEVYWRRNRSGDAVYFRDIRQASPSAAGDWKAAWEFVEVTHSDLSRVSLWLNIFKANASRPITGVVRIQWNGRTVDSPFSFSVRRGNGGIDSEFPARATSPYWQRVDLVQLFNQAQR